MTPATKLLNKQKIDFELHEYEHNKNSESYGLEATEKMGISSDLVFIPMVLQDAKSARQIVPRC